MTADVQFHALLTSHYTRHGVGFMLWFIYFHVKSSW